MKRILLTFLFIAVAFSACAQAEYLYRDSATAMWNAPVVDLVPGETLEYDVYLSDVSNGDPGLLATGSMISVGRATTETLIIDMTAYARARYYLVVQSVLIQLDLVEVLGGIGNSLSDADPLLAPLGWFYISEAATLANPFDLRDSGM